MSKGLCSSMNAPSPTRHFKPMFSRCEETHQKSPASNKMQDGQPNMRSKHRTWHRGLLNDTILSQQQAILPDPKRNQEKLRQIYRFG